MVYPWHEAQWKSILGAPERLPHALLLAGPGGVGKWAFAASLALRLLCERAQGTEQACGSCQACRWGAAQNHPDLVEVVPEVQRSAAAGDGDADVEPSPARKAKPSKQIRIEQVRALNRMAALGSHQGGRRVVIIHPAEAMNTATANALLKVLEEPPATTLFILISHAPSLLLPTILSRCQRVALGRPDASVAAAWLAAEGVADAHAELAFSGGCPSLAKAYAESPQATGHRAALIAQLAQAQRLDPVAAAAVCEAGIKASESDTLAFGLPQLVDCVQKWVADLIRANAGLPVRFHVGAAERLAETGARATSGSLFDCYNYLLRLKPYVEHPLNSRLFIEDVLIRYVRAVAPGGGH